MNEFAVVLGIGAALGLLRVSRQRQGLWLDAGLLVLMTALIGARLGYVLVHLSYFSTHAAEILALKSGGLTFGGAVAGWVVGLALAALIHRANPLRLADWLYPLIPALAVAGYLACWLAGAAYGPQLPAGVWWGLHSPDESGLVALRWPIQPAAALSLLVFYGLMERLIPLPRPSGWLFSLAGSWLILVDLVVSLLRADPQPVWRGLRLATLSDLIALILFLGLFAGLTFVARRRSKSMVVKTV